MDNEVVYRVRGEFFFPWKRLVVRSEVLGTTTKLRRGESVVEIKFPSEYDLDFARMAGEEPLFERDAIRLNEECFSNVHVVLVAVHIGCQAEILEDTAFSLAESVIAEFIDWHRVRGQIWLGLHGQKPEPLLSGGRRSWLIDEETGTEPEYQIAIDLSGITEHPRILARLESFLGQFPAAADSDSLAHIGEKIGRSERPTLAQLMLADALYFADRFDPDLRRALLLAAIACELKIKEVLRTKASSSQRELVELLLANPRDFTMQAAGLFDKALRATLGCSLRERNKGLYKRTERLFQLRNKLAHEGQAPEDAAIDCVSAAREVFAWLDAVSEETAEKTVG